MNKYLRRTTVAVVVAVTALSVAPSVLADHGGSNLPSSYELGGDDGGSKFEGIGIDQAESTFYVSEVTGGEIHRGDVVTGETEEWIPEGTDGRFTARGIATDAHDRVYIAGGPNGLDTDLPDLWVYSQDGGLLAALKVNEPNAFINDVTIGPDGAAYFTNSNAPQIFRVAEVNGEWEVETWADASNTITEEPGFNLGGIVVSPNRRALVVAQGNVGSLWRFDLATATATRIETGDADLTNADGLVSVRQSVVVIRNFAHAIATVNIDRDAQSGRLVRQAASDPDKVFTTGAVAHGRLLVIDSHFDETVAEPPYEVVSLRLDGRPTTR